MIIERLEEALPKMTDFDKGVLVGTAEAMASKEKEETK